MPTVKYAVDFPNDTRPSDLPPETRAVLARDYVYLDQGQGGITFEEIAPEDIAGIVTYPTGSDLFVESPDRADVLDNTDESTEAATRIWWRAVVESR